jgi:hypothetical protein
MHFGFVDVVLMHICQTSRFCYSYGNFQAGENKNTNINKMHHHPEDGHMSGRNMLVTAMQRN